MDAKPNPVIPIGVFSSAASVAGQGVGSAYQEQVSLLRLHPEDFEVHINEKGRWPIQHFHTIDPKFYLKMNSKALNIAYCHFLPDTLKGSLRIPGFVQPLVSAYVVSFYKKADYLVVVNPSFIQELENYGLDKERIVYIPNFVSDRNFYELKQEETGAIRDEYGIARDKFTVLGCGQVQTRKGVKEFIEVAKSLPEIQFVWAGGFSFGKLTDGYDELKEIMDHPPENVIFTGIIEREKMNAIYNMSDLLFIPSYAELFPMTILEASSAHRPILCRDLELYEDILFDHYLKGKDNEEFIRIIDRLSRDRGFYEQRVNHAKALSRFYSPEHVYEMWKEFYQKAYGEYLDKQS